MEEKKRDIIVEQTYYVTKDGKEFLKKEDAVIYENLLLQKFSLDHLEQIEDNDGETWVYCATEEDYDLFLTYSAVYNEIMDIGLADAFVPFQGPDWYHALFGDEYVLGMSVESLSDRRRVWEEFKGRFEPDASKD